MRLFQSFFAATLLAIQLRAEQVSSFGELTSKIGGLAAGAAAEYELTQGFSMQGYQDFIEINEGVNVTITCNDGVVTMDASLQGRFFAVHGSLTMVNFVLKNAQGENTGGAFYVNGGHLDVQNITFDGCVPGPGAAGGAFAVVAGGSADITDCKFMPTGDADDLYIDSASSVVFHSSHCSKTVNGRSPSNNAAKDLPPTKEIVQCTAQCTPLKDLSITTKSIKVYAGVTGAQACCSLCGAFDGCVAFSITGTSCNLKDDTRVTPAAGVTSGILKEC